MHPKRAPIKDPRYTGLKETAALRLQQNEPKKREREREKEKREKNRITEEAAGGRNACMYSMYTSLYVIPYPVPRELANISFSIFRFE